MLVPCVCLCQLRVSAFIVRLHIVYSPCSDLAPQRSQGLGMRLITITGLIPIPCRLAPLDLGRNRRSFQVYVWRGGDRLMPWTQYKRT